MFQSGRKLLYEKGRGFCFLSEFFGFVFIVFAGLPYRAVLSLSKTVYEKKGTGALPGLCAYGMRRSGCCPEWSMELLAFANRLFTPNCVEAVLRRPVSS